MAKKSGGLFRKQALDRLSSPDQLDQLMQIVSPRSWLILVGLAALLVLCVAWSLLGTITTTVDAPGVLSDDGTVRLYLSPAEAARLQAGMSVRVTMTNVRPQEYGYLVGRVVEVGAVPIDAERLLEQVGNRTLTEALVAEGDPVEVKVRLTLSSTISGYAWTSSAGPEFELVAGTPCFGQVTLEEKRPISIILPV